MIRVRRAFRPSSLGGKLLSLLPAAALLFPGAATALAAPPPGGSATSVPGTGVPATTAASWISQGEWVPAPDSIPGVRRLVTPADYGRFENLGATTFSPGGGWVSVVVTRFDADGEVRLHPTDSRGEPRVFEKGVRAEVSEGDRWAAVVMAPGQEERRRLEASRTPVRNDLVLVDLEGDGEGEGPEEVIREVASFAFSPDGRFLLLRRYPPANGNRATRGVDILVRELGTGVVTNFGNVSEASWADEGALLAMVVDAEGQAGNGVRLFNPATGQLRTLHAQEARFQGLTWRDESRDLALFRVEPDTVRGDTTFAVLAWTGADRDGATPAILPGAVRPVGAEGAFRVTDVRGLRWSEDGGRLFLALQTRAPAEEDGPGDDAVEPETDPDDPDVPTRAQAPRAGGGGGAGADSVPGLEIWHSRDVDPVPQQRLRANQERRRSALASWEVRGETVPVYLGGDGAGEVASLLPGERRVLLLDDEPWGSERMFGPVYRDVHVVDVATGSRIPVRQRVEFSLTPGTTGRYLLFFEADHFLVHDLERGETRNLTEGLDAVFANQETDVVVPQRPPYGVGGWTEDDRHLLLYDRYDIWQVAVDGSGAQRLTDGAAEAVRHRLLRLDPDQDAWPRGGPWTVSLYGDRTKWSGWGELRPGREVERRVWADRGTQRLARSEDGRRHLWISQRYEDPPTLHLAGARLENPVPLFQANAFVADEFLWGRAELLDFENGWGVPLQAVLHYPADFQPGRQYPMVVYHYERLSQGLHNWVNPSDRSAYNITAFTQNGYFVLQPDIVYRPRDPGRSAMATFDPALDAALATGHVDPARVGIMGHSWGGYQTTFAVTQTDRFAAAVAGAPLTNLVSMYLSFYWNSGGTDARIFEISQGRMEVPWWEDYEAYVANSPVHHIERMNTPLLMAFGTEDGAVEFNQGVEFYNAARRAAKDFVLLVYEGENHSLARRPNQEDYHRRTLEWFDHYLKGAPALPWITEGVGYLEQQEKLQRGPAAGRLPAGGG